MKTDQLRQIHIDSAQRHRPAGSYLLIYIVVAAITLAGAYFAWPRKSDETRVVLAPGSKTQTISATPAPASTQPLATAKAKADDVVLTVSGYIVNRERIEISPRFMGQVKWIGVKKGDLVKKDDVIVRLDDAEQRARLLEIQGQLSGAKISLERAKLAYERILRLRASQNETAEREDEARLTVDAAVAVVQQIQGMRDTVEVQLDWTVIRAPIDGVVLEKLADPGELVTPQSFGGTRGPSTALVALADPHDLQVEIDINESDLPKIAFGQKCRVTPEAYPDKTFDGHVAEIAPEANRQKGTLQIKVQIEAPDRHLTPELSAKVDFLRTAAPLPVLQ